MHQFLSTPPRMKNTVTTQIKRRMNSTKVKKKRPTPLWWCTQCIKGAAQISGVHDTHEECAPIIDGLGHAPPCPRVARDLITVNNSIS